MNIENRCVYEQLQDKYPDEPIISNKGLEIVLEPAGIKRLAKVFGGYFSQYNLEDICRNCRLCTPRITVREQTWRIKRDNYQPVNIGEPFIVRLMPEGIKHPARNRFRLTIVDDGCMASPSPLKDTELIP